MAGRWAFFLRITNNPYNQPTSIMDSMRCFFCGLCLKVLTRYLSKQTNLGRLKRSSSPAVNRRLEAKHEKDGQPGSRHGSSSSWVRSAFWKNESKQLPYVATYFTKRLGSMKLMQSTFPEQTSPLKIGPRKRTFYLPTINFQGLLLLVSGMVNA